MQKRKLGNTNIHLSSLGFGAAPIGDLFENLDERSCYDILENAFNSNFNLLVSKCRGVTPARDNTRPDDSQSLWDDMKDDYKKENPDIKLMGDKFIGPKDEQ